ncbi:uncharacterized protein LOC125661304 [Ostrea edulis]|uniref:uncharacterized protein LOC125661304 n=1 Tax=Ostrea edulis TaxID=37623 RepID=UPI0024AFE834|nr:uncharacterized protein LOC125661304 [Ostrea edulis]
MVNTCVVWGCTNRSRPGDSSLKFFDIPKVIEHQGIQTKELTSERRRIWLARINRADFSPDPSKRHFKVCSDHFIQGMKADLFDKTNPDWAPSLKLRPTQTNGLESSKKRYERTQTRKGKKVKFQTAEALLKLQEIPHSEEDMREIESTDINCDPPDSDSGKCTFLLEGTLECRKREMESEEEREIKRLKQENLALKEKLCAGTGEVSPETFKEEEKVKHYTGLSYSILMALFSFLEPHIPYTSRSALTKFQKLVLVLMKLRLNLGIQDLGYRFKVTPSCVSKTFLDVIHVIPSNLLARAETWSNYKHHNTVKYLIGITPQGAVSFLSSGYGGRVPDKYITENCGLLAKLLPGDVVLADRGFNISENVGLCCAEVKIPAFTRGKEQLSPLELEATRKIAHTRIHVERVIGLVRNKFSILQGTIPIDYLHCQAENVPTIDKITTVCCALTNLCDSVVPFG